MKNNRIESFFFAIMKAVVFVVMHDKICEVISLNGFSSLDKYMLFLEEKRKKAALCYLDFISVGLEKCRGFHNCLVAQVQDELSLYNEIDEITHYKKLVIMDENEATHEFSELTLSAQQKISSFLSIQYDELLSFAFMLTHSDNMDISAPVDSHENSKLMSASEVYNSAEKPKKQYMDEKLEEGDRWLDNQEACLFLKVSKRTLQRYRDNAILPYYYLGNKIYYKYSDLVKLINSNQGRRKG